MADLKTGLDFAALRYEVEAATRLPDFDDVKRRARRARLRDRLATAGALLATMLIFMPVVVAAIRARPDGDTAFVGLNPPDGGTTQTTPTLATSEVDRPMSILLRAAAGADFEHLYAAIDVCNGPGTARRCLLQVVPLANGQSPSRGPIHTGALRASVTDGLTDVQLQPLSPDALLVGGSAAGRRHSYLRIATDGGGAGIPQPPTERLNLGPGDRLIQLDDYGELYGVRSADERLSRLPSQPPLTQVSANTSIEPTLGWWVTGHDPVTGALAVAVSRDRGATWTSQALNVPTGLDVPTLATYDGTTAYAFVRATDGLRQVRTTDGGSSWSEVRATIPWPAALARPGALAGRGFGAIVRPDGSLLVWIDDETAPVFVESDDEGRTYRAVSGPPGHVVPVAGGYAALSNPPQLSRDGYSWGAIARPTVAPPA